ncbi:FecR family protein [Parapedobacter tibetensis]|uniref:FecR family protein n=1 Tax=Parapedobacter tibetensis TaxID=2972951 RepID=UPI00214DB844|nr:FecR family protein [Parapedobacter tibetensis]
MEAHKAKRLLKKYLAGNCTEEEKAVLETWYLQRNLEEFPDLNEADRLQDMEEVRLALEKAYNPVRRMKPRHRLARVVAAAMVLLAAGIVLYVYMQKDAGTPQLPARYANDVDPGGNKAVLTLADGKTINLSSDKEGIMVSGGALTYDDGTVLPENTPEGISQYVALTTPVGGQYRVVLPDGSKVWLNAASTLRYPTRFTAKERKVEVSGEAYFEVAHDKAVPFKVNTQGQTIEVLGTHFNVSAYQDEPITKTTLLEGSVRITTQDRSEYLVPGQQAQVNSRHLTITDDADMDEVVSWKNGYFKFNGNIEGIMTKVARWYNVEVVYQEGVDLHQTFSGELSRARKLSTLLELMEITGNVHFKIEGKRVTVMP